MLIELDTMNYRNRESYTTKPRVGIFSDSQWISACLKFGLLILCVIIVTLSLDWIVSSSSTWKDTDLCSHCSIKALVENATSQINKIGINTTCYMNDDPFSRHVLPDKHLRERGCEKRLPVAVIIGSDHCRTDILSSYLRQHPYIVFPKSYTMQYFDKFFHLTQKWYKNQMPYTLEQQLTMETTSTYLAAAEVPSRMLQELKYDVKLIVVVCDPVLRSLREFTRQQDEETTWLQDTEAEKVSPLNETYLSSISYSKGRFNTSNPLITNGAYIDLILNWMVHFPRKNFHIVNEDSLVFSPFRVLNKIENFLQIPRYFRFEDFVFQNDIGRYCLTSGIQCELADENNHLPLLAKDIRKRLLQHFEREALMLQNTFDVKLSWRKHTHNVLS